MSPKTILILTGNELLAGDTLDSNSAFIGQLLLEIGLPVTKKITIGDHLEQLTNIFLEAVKEADLVIINGGLGPTIDDYTAEAASQAFGLPLVQNQEAFEHMQAYIQQNSLPKKTILKQTLLPKGSKILPNPWGTAVGFILQYQNCYLFFTPGPPRELNPMLENYIIPYLTELFSKPPIQRIRLRCFGLGESIIQEQITQHIKKQDLEGLNLGFRASFPYVEIKLQTINSSQTNNQQLLKGKQHLQDLFQDYIFGENDDTLSVILSNLLKQQHLTLTIAESCTGGLIAAELTALPGASTILHSGFVCYANHAKETLLDVPKYLLEKYGAVSEQVVTAMAEGALKRTGADCVLATSGIAGPDGGSKEKPVGTVFIAWGNQKKIFVRKFYLTKTRKDFQKTITNIAFDLLRRFLSNLNQDLTIKN